MTADQSGRPHGAGARCDEGENGMGLLRRGKDKPGRLRTADSADARHLEQFVASRSGVEAFLEPPTSVTAATVVLVAGSGEWTRRRVADADAAASFARKRGIPLYEVAKIGYPQRMRDWNAARKGSGESSIPDRDGVA